MNCTIHIILLATELLDFGSLSMGNDDEDEFEADNDSSSHHNGMIKNNHMDGKQKMTRGGEQDGDEDNLSYISTPAGTQFGEIGERIRSAKASSRIKQKPSIDTSNSIINHI